MPRNGRYCLAVEQMCRIFDGTTHPGRRIGDIQGQIELRAMLRDRDRLYRQAGQAQGRHRVHLNIDQCLEQGCPAIVPLRRGQLFEQAVERDRPVVEHGARIGPEGGDQIACAHPGAQAYAIDLRLHEEADDVLQRLVSAARIGNADPEIDLPGPAREQDRPCGEDDDERRASLTPGEAQHLRGQLGRQDEIEPVAHGLRIDAARAVNGHIKRSYWPALALDIPVQPAGGARNRLRQMTCTMGIALGTGEVGILDARRRQQRGRIP